MGGPFHRREFFERHRPYGRTDPRLHGCGIESMKLVMGICVTVCFAVFAGQMSAAPAHYARSMGQTVKLLPKRIHRREGNRYELNVAFPQIANPATPNERKLNRWLERAILENVADFHRHLGASASGQLNGPSGPDELLEIRYQVVNADRDLISLHFTDVVSAHSQIHPNAYPVTFNYDLRRGRSLKLADIFQDKVGYLPVIAEYCQAELKRKYSDQLFNNDGAAAKAENYQNWNIGPEGLVISFNDYQVGPHAMGRPMIVIPFSALSMVLDRQGIVRKFINARR